MNKRKQIITDVLLNDNFSNVQESTNLKVWKVQPKRYHKGYCPTICKSRRVAEFEQERLERITGFEWAIKIMME